ncbi:MAG: hypothetical protein H0X24_14165 [Ktedonobacterales bacterium]|nr:hypothetical protein [Ktedonobacterales bacterium]
MPKPPPASKAENQLSALEVLRGRMDLAMYGFLTRGLQAAEHHKGIINAVAPKEWNKGSVVVCPPGSGKSTWISEIAIPWIIGNDPTKLILHLHANDEKANAYLTTLQQTYEQNSRHEEIFPDVRPDIERGWSSRGLYFKWRDQTGRWPIVDNEGWAHQGAKDPQYVSIGYMGGAIGRRADVIILDDPFDPNEIDSPTWRARFLKRFVTVIKTRLKPGGRIIFVCNRWHYDDAVPRLAQMGYELVTFPAIMETEGLDGEKIETSYWPEMFPIAALHDIRNDFPDPIDFLCLYQGNPGSAEGNTFKKEHFQQFDVDEDRKLIRFINASGEEQIIPFRACRWFQAVDPAASIKTRADYFVIATVAFYQGFFFLIDIVRKKIPGPEQPDAIADAYQYWHPYAIGIEKVAYQLTLIQYANKRGLPIIELARHGDKASRQATLAARYRSKMVLHRRGAPWLYDYETELVQIPNGKHDDQADAVGDACEALGGKTSGMSAEKRSAMALAQHSTRNFAQGRW